MRINEQDKFSMMVASGGILTALAIGVYFVRAFFAVEVIPPCTAHASQILQLNVLTQSGEPMSPIELQGELGINAHGIFDNATVVKLNDGPPTTALRIKLSKGSSSPHQFEVPPGGISFLWQPDSLQRATSVCLRYAIRLPDDFEYGDGGFLPGLFGGDPMSPSEESDGKNGFTAGIIWRNDGKSQILAQLPNSTTSNPALLQRVKFKIPTGRWVWIDQELVLNNSGYADGALKLWIDGELTYQQDEITWRFDDALTVSGVTGAVHYGFGNAKRSSIAPKNTAVELSPFELSWR